MEAKRWEKALHEKLAEAQENKKLVSIILDGGVTKTGTVLRLTTSELRDIESVTLALGGRAEMGLRNNKPCLIKAAAIIAVE